MTDKRTTPAGHTAAPINGMPTPIEPLTVARAAELLDALTANVASVVLGKPDIIRNTLVALFAEGHVLIEDVPGVGKTLLAKAIARSLACEYHRVQFTPDLLPGDLLGTSVYRQATGEFEFQPGPIFAQIILADEINRATPRTQSALLEAMSERQVSIDGRTRPLGPPFLVLATQNPFEFEGTYPLPESQLDRFLMRLHVGYPDRQAEREILTCHRAGEPVDQLKPVLRDADVLAIQLAVRQVRFESSLAEYVLDLIHATRDHADIALGASTRAGLALYRAAQSLALIHGRDYVIPDDIQCLAPAVLTHRLLTRGYRQGSRDETAAEIVAEIVEQTPIP